MDVTTLEFKNMVLSGRKIKLCEIVEVLSIKHGTVFSVFHEKLRMKKI